MLYHNRRPPPRETYWYHPYEWIIGIVVLWVTLTWIGRTPTPPASRVIESLHDMGIHVAAWLPWIYGIGGVGALAALRANLGQGETSVQRQRRHFCQTLNDPLLRANIQRDAEREYDGDAAQVAAFMPKLDAKAAAWADSHVDDEWKQQEAVRLAWRGRIAFLWGLRRVLIGLACVSCVLLYWDRAAWRGVYVWTFLWIGTYYALPLSPDDKTDASQPIVRAQIV